MTENFTEVRTIARCEPNTRDGTSRWLVHWRGGGSSPTLPGAAVANAIGNEEWHNTPILVTFSPGHCIVGVASIDLDNFHGYGAAPVLTEKVRRHAMTLHEHTQKREGVTRGTSD